MRAFGPKCAAALIALGLAQGSLQGSLHAESIAPTVASTFETGPFSEAELRHGKVISEAECGALSGAVWVVAGRQQQCIRYYHTARADGRSEAIVYLHDDVVSINGRGEVQPNAGYIKLTPAGQQAISTNWSRNLEFSYLFLGRPGTFGSSGEHGRRRTPEELVVISAALDAIKGRYGYTRLHLVGWAKGGHGAAALLARRDDLGCVVLASALLSVRSWLAEFGRKEDLTGNRNPVDPIAVVGQIVNRPDLRIFVLTDPDDTVISARSQTAYVKRLTAAGLPVRQIFAAAPDPFAHALVREALQVAAACAKGMDDDAIVAKFQNKVPQTPPDADEPPLHRPEILWNGVNISEAECKSIVTALWVRVEGRGYCVRYWMSTAGGKSDEAMVYIHGDIGGIENGKAKLVEGLDRLTAAQLRRDAQRWSRIFRGPYIAVGRVGAFGSSGNHRDRRTLLEVRVIMAALDVLKERYGIKRFHLVGQSGGGHTVAVLTQRRADIGCAVMASSSISVRSRGREQGKTLGPRIYDPIDAVGRMEHQPGRRMIVLSDPGDRIVSFRSQREFVERVKTKGLPIVQITASAGDKNFHALSAQGRHVAMDCAKGMDDAALAARHQAKSGQAPR